MKITTVGMNLARSAFQVGWKVHMRDLNLHKGNG